MVRRDFRCVHHRSTALLAPIIVLIATLLWGASASARDVVVDGRRTNTVNLNTEDTLRVQPRSVIEVLGGNAVVGAGAVAGGEG